MRFRFSSWAVGAVALTAASTSALAAEPAADAVTEAATDVDAEAQPIAADEAERRAKLEAAVAAGIAAFERTDYAAALVQFEHALSFAIESEQQGTLHFNAGVCAFEMRRYEAAELHFLRAYATGYAEATTAQLHAGFAALYMGDSKRARERLSAAKPASDEERDLAQQLREQITSEQLNRRQKQAERELAAGIGALNARRLAQAQRLLERALQSGALPVASQVDGHYALARVHELRGQPEMAKRSLDAAIALRSDHELYWFRGDVHRAQHQRGAAIADYESALDRHPPASDAKLIQRSIDALHPLGPAGWQGLLALSVGIDTNASQSGTAGSQGLATSQQGSGTSSPVLGLEARLGHSSRLGDRWALEPTLWLSSALLTRSSVRPLSLSASQLALNAHYAPTLFTRLTATAGATSMLTDWPALTPFTTEAFVGAAVRVEHHENWLLSGLLRATRVVGHDQAAALTGSRLEAQLAEQVGDARRWLGLLARATLVSAGDLTVAADSTLPALCRIAMRPCLVGQFIVPLSYFEPAVGPFGGWLPTRRLMLDSAVTLSYRHYLDPSTLLVVPGGTVPGSFKSRRDWVVDASLGARWSFGDSALVGPFTELRQTARFNRSNLQPDLTDPAHRFDYDDRNFDQFITTLTAGWAF